MFQPPSNACARGHRKGLVILALLMMLPACASLGSSGPTTGAIKGAQGKLVDQAGIQVIDITDAVARRAIEAGRPVLFSDALGDAPATPTVIQRGDVVDVTIFEAPPAALFGTSASFGAGSVSSALQGATSGNSQRTALPEMMVDDTGHIRVPFAGSILAAGRTPPQVARQITSRLTGKAHDPEVIVRLVTNSSANVSVLGEVATNGRIGLTPRGERLLDALASAGGVRQPADKITIQVTRAGRVVSLPLDAIIRDASQNVRLQTDDVVAAIYQPFSFTSLGMTGTSAEVPFEQTGITLSQALGRMGGLKDDRANARGVFIFRLENPAAIDPVLASTARRTADGRIPVIYRVDLRNPATMFVAQSFPIRNKDVIYASSAPLGDFQRFVGILSSLAFTAIGLGQAVP
jgi:polysaccharide export outer membrane protein